MTTKKCIRSVFVAAVVLVLFSSPECRAEDFPTERVPRCNYGDVECIQRSAEFILQSQKDGITALNVPSLDPINLSDIKMENPGIVNINLLLSGGKMFGLSKSKVNYVRGFTMEFDPLEYNEMEVVVPQVSIISPYNIDGKVFLFPIKGSGNTNFTFDNLQLRFKFRGKPISRDEKLYFEATDMELNMTTSKLYLNFDNLFNGDKFLCDQANNLLNRRSEDVFRELKRQVESSFSAEVTERVNKAFSNFPYSDYFLPGPVPQSKVLPEVREGKVKRVIAAAADTEGDTEAASSVEGKSKGPAEEKPKESSD